MESAETTSPPARRASSTATAVLPEAVGPAMTGSRGLAKALPPYWMRRNMRSISRRENVLITGLPCGQVGGAPEASICASSASISESDSTRPPP